MLNFSFRHQVQPPRAGNLDIQALDFDLEIIDLRQNYEADRGEQRFEFDKFLRRAGHEFCLVDGDDLECAPRDRIGHIKHMSRLL